MSPKESSYLSSGPQRKIFSVSKLVCRNSELALLAQVELQSLKNPYFNGSE